MTIMNNFRNLCTPAALYLVIAGIGFIISVYENYDCHYYKLAGHTCDIGNKHPLFIFKLLYILFWTWVLNALCKSNHPKIAWFLFLLPLLSFILISIIILLIFFTAKRTSKEGMENKNTDTGADADNGKSISDTNKKLNKIKNDLTSVLQINKKATDDKK